MKKEVKKRLMHRLKIIEGQIRGLQKMVQEEKYCIDIITQSQAVKRALSSVESLILKNHLETHAAHQMESGKHKKAVAEILSVYDVSNKH